MHELEALGATDATVVVDGFCAATVPDQACAARCADPVWALNVWPGLVTLEAESVGALAAVVVDVIADAIDGPRWAMTCCAAGAFRGNPAPKMARRVELLHDAIVRRLERIRRRSLRRRVDVDAQPGAALPPHERLVQLAMLSPTQVVVSVADVRVVGVASLWPSAHVAGHAPVAPDPAAPASSYRKLEEAFALLGAWPVAGERAMDLGASPGGWTAVLRRYGAEVIAIDRAPLAPRWMADGGVTFVMGDAFAAEPPPSLDWLVSDIVAFPERIVALLGDLGRLGPRRFVVQMKFRREVDWPAIAAGLAAARALGYDVRCKHLFHDKNEVTFAGHRERSAPPSGA